MTVKKARAASKLNKATLIAEDERKALAKSLGLKRNTQNFIDTLHANPGMSQTQAYLDTHRTTNRKAASVEATKLLHKPSVQIYSNDAVNKAKRKIVTLIDSEQDSIALKASESIIDRTFGKPLNKSESVAKTIEVKLDLGSVRVGAHYIQAQAVSEG